MSSIFNKNNVESNIIRFTHIAYPYGEGEFKDLILDSLHKHNVMDYEITEKTRTIGEYEKFNVERKYIYIKTKDDVLGPVGDIDNHKSEPKQEFSVVRPHDYTIACVAGWQKERINEVLQRRFQSRSELQMDVVESTMVSLVEHSNELEERLSSLENVFEKSGLMYFQSFADKVLDFMDSKGEIDAETVKEQIFKVQH